MVTDRRGGRVGRIERDPPTAAAVARARGAPARARRAALALAVTLALAAVVVDGSPAGVTTTAEAASRVPVILVHGFNGSTASFDVMAARLRRRGHTVVVIELPGQDNVANAKAIRALVAAPGWKKVAIVGHSMGGLSSREWIKFYGGRTVAVTYVSLGSPQQGLPVTCVLPLTDGGQMCPDSAFMRKLNAGDDTPGPLSWTSVASATDELVPVAATRLTGGACNVRVKGPDHGGLLTDPAVFRIVVGAIDGKPCAGTFVR